MGSGHGQSFKFGSTTIPHVEDAKLTNKGQIMSKAVADLTLPLTISIPGLAKWTVTFTLPSTTPQTVLAAIAQGTAGAIEHNDVDGVKFTAAAGVSNGYDVGAASGGWVTITAEFAASGALTVAAAS